MLGEAAIMAVLSTVATATVAGLFVAVLWYLNGRDVPSTLDYVLENAGTVLLASEIVVLCLLFATKHYLAGAILLTTALLTVFGVVGVSV